MESPISEEWGDYFCMMRVNLVGRIVMRDKLVFYWDRIVCIWQYVLNEIELDIFDMKGNLGITEICNPFRFWYNKDTKRAELELDSDVDRWKDGGKILTLR